MVWRDRRRSGRSVWEVSSVSLCDVAVHNSDWRSPCWSGGEAAEDFGRSGLVANRHDASVVVFVMDASLTRRRPFFCCRTAQLRHDCQACSVLRRGIVRSCVWAVTGGGRPTQEASYKDHTCNPLHTAHGWTAHVHLSSVLQPSAPFERATADCDCDELFSTRSRM